jgi:hypothetical protein
LFFAWVVFFFLVFFFFFLGSLLRSAKQNGETCRAGGTGAAGLISVKFCLLVAFSGFLGLLEPVWRFLLLLVFIVYLLDLYSKQQATLLYNKLSTSNKQIAFPTHAPQAPGLSTRKERTNSMPA